MLKPKQWVALSFVLATLMAERDDALQAALAAPVCWLPPLLLPPKKKRKSILADSVCMPHSAAQMHCSSLAARGSRRPTRSETAPACQRTRSTSSARRSTAKPRRSPAREAGRSPTILPRLAHAAAPPLITLRLHPMPMLNAASRAARPGTCNYCSDQRAPKSLTFVLPFSLVHQYTTPFAVLHHMLKNQMYTDARLLGSVKDRQRQRPTRASGRRRCCARGSTCWPPTCFPAAPGSRREGCCRPTRRRAAG